MYSASNTENNESGALVIKIQKCTQKRETEINAMVMTHMKGEEMRASTTNLNGKSPSVQACGHFIMTNGKQDLKKCIKIKEIELDVSNTNLIQNMIMNRCGINLQ